jgi:hypothetical protein
VREYTEKLLKEIVYVDSGVPAVIDFSSIREASTDRLDPRAVKKAQEKGDKKHT